MTYRLTVNGVVNGELGTRDAPPARRPARRPRPDRDEGGLRRGRVRRLHGPRRWRGRRQLPGAPSARSTGRTVETVEGLTRGLAAEPAQPSALGPLQRAFLETGGAQCGICTPGMLIAGEAFLDVRRRSRPTTRSGRRSPATSAAAPATRRSSRRSRLAARRAGGTGAGGLTMPAEPPVVSPTSLAEAYACCARRRIARLPAARTCWSRSPARSVRRRTGSWTCGGSTSCAGSRSEPARWSSAP